jgi:AraC-like DNA-binding protein
VPRAALATRCDVPRLREPVVATLGSARGTDRGAGQYARTLARMTSGATRASLPLPADEGTVLDLVAVLAAGRAAAPATAHRAAARSYIEEHLIDPKLGAAQVAAAIGLSERQLSRVFAAAGTSVPRHILSRRLRLAYLLLSREEGASDTVADIATQSGFTSATYFSHAFRAEFGQRARDIRAAREYPTVAAAAGAGYERRRDGALS